MQTGSQAGDGTTDREHNCQKIRSCNMQWRTDWRGRKLSESNCKTLLRILMRVWGEGDGTGGGRRRKRRRRREKDPVMARLWLKATAARQLTTRTKASRLYSNGASRLSESRWAQTAPADEPVEVQRYAGGESRRKAKGRRQGRRNKKRGKHC